MGQRDICFCVVLHAESKWVGWGAKQKERITLERGGKYKAQLGTEVSSVINSRDGAISSSARWPTAHPGSFFRRHVCEHIKGLEIVLFHRIRISHAGGQHH